ncbi:MAG: hypothetical protein KGO99_05380 [Actinomycetales bacterium]|nr:hypothetical protein [Actinomycetales bacterium]
MESTNIKIAPSATGKIRFPHKAAELFNEITAQLTQQVLNLEEQTVDLGERAVFFRVCEMMIRRWIAAGWMC